ncbi:hypothetical protein A2U01_0070137 [Trifolium medium]|uniref:Uncharacterized protein n=1 Tax=Trifolium medium TaxID=97028 RepID=A0A392SL16_9FABA|nr:hypothetical protein [Trifolium medium]
MWPLPAIIDYGSATVDNCATQSATVLLRFDSFVAEPTPECIPFLHLNPNAPL